LREQKNGEKNRPLDTLKPASHKLVSAYTQLGFLATNGSTHRYYPYLHTAKADTTSPYWLFL